MASLLSKRVAAIEATGEAHEKRVAVAQEINANARLVGEVTISVRTIHGGTLGNIKLSQRHFAEALAIVEKQGTYSAERAQKIQNDLKTLSDLSKYM